MRVSEIRVNQIRVNQGLGVHICNSKAMFPLTKQLLKKRHGYGGL